MSVSIFCVLGSMLGLNLILNIEHYEYMGGPHNSAGVKILLHDSDEVPFVGDMGFNVPPGRQSLIGINAKRVNFFRSSTGGSCEVATGINRHTEAYQNKKFLRISRKICEYVWFL